MAYAPVTLAPSPRSDRTTHLLLVLVLAVQLVSLALDLAARDAGADACAANDLGSLFPGDPDPGCG